MVTHTLYAINNNTISVNGIGNYFSWFLEYEYGEWELSTAYGRRQGTFKTVGDALRSIGWGGEMICTDCQFQLGIQNYEFHYKSFDKQRSIFRCAICEEIMPSAMTDNRYYENNLLNVIASKEMEM